MRSAGRWSVLAAVVAVLAGGAACAKPSQPQPSTPSVTPSTAITPTAPTTTATVASSLSSLTGTLYFLGPPSSAGGVYTLHNGVLTRILGNSSFAFYQTATVSPDGQRIVWVLNDAVGATGQLRVHTVGGGDTTIGPNTIINVLTPQYLPDAGEVIVGYGSNQSGELNLTSGTMSPYWSTCCLYLISDDGAYAILNGTSRVVLSSPSTAPVPVVAPSGERYRRIQSLAPDGQHAIVLMQPIGAPEGDPGRTLQSNAIVNYVTGTSEATPGGGTLKAGVYYHDGSAILRVDAGGTDTVRLVSPTGTVVDHLDLPTSVANLSFLTYIP
jgi:hypothetical protein